MRFAAFALSFIACAAPSVWRTQEEACEELRDSGTRYACLGTTTSHEAKWSKQWTELASALPPGETILHMQLDARGGIVDIGATEQSAPPDVVGEAMRVLRDNAPYLELVDKRRVFVRFSVKPLEVALVVRPRGDVGVVYAALKQRHGAFLQCYSDAAQWEKKPFSGTIHVLIDKDGHVGDARVESDSGLDEELSACLIDAAKTIALPPWQHDGQQAKLPLDFKTQDKRKKVSRSSERTEKN